MGDQHREAQLLEIDHGHCETVAGVQREEGNERRKPILEEVLKDRLAEVAA
jgi:hypothetical protein